MWSRRYMLLLKSGVVLGILSGLIWQSSLITMLYVEYRVINLFSLSIPKQVAVDPSISICPSHYQLINRSEFSKLLNQRGIRGVDVSNLTIRDAEGILTIDDIFRLTPRPEDIFHTCRFRRTGSYLSFNETTECNEVFHVVRFFYLSNVCYRFTQHPPKHNIDEENEEEFSSALKSGPVLSYEKIRTTSDYPGLITDIVLDKEFLENVTALTISISDTFPRGFDHFPYYIVKRAQRRRFQKELRYSFTFSWVKNRLLPPPYETRCRDWRTTTKGLYGSDQECVDGCILSIGAKEFQRVIASSLVFDPTTLGHLLNDFFRAFNLSLIPQTTADMRNDTIRKRIRTIEKDCMKQCCQPDCLETKFMTRLVSIERSMIEHYSFRIYLPDYPVMETNYSPYLEFVGYLLYICNCVNFWCGLSICKLSIIVPLIKKQKWKHSFHFATWKQNRRKSVSIPFCLVFQNQLKKL